MTASRSRRTTRSTAESGIANKGSHYAAFILLGRWSLFLLTGHRVIDPGKGGVEIELEHLFDVGA